MNKATMFAWARKINGAYGTKLCEIDAGFRRNTKDCTIAEIFSGEKWVLERGEPSSQPERTSSVGNTKNGSEEPDGG